MLSSVEFRVCKSKKFANISCTLVYLLLSRSFFTVISAHYEWNCEIVEMAGTKVGVRREMSTSNGKIRHIENWIVYDCRTR